MGISRCGRIGGTCCLQVPHAPTASADGLHIATKAIDVRPGFTAEHLVIGCIYKEMALKPNILDEVSGDRSVDLKPEPRLNYCSAGDSVILEDESGRLALTAGACRRSLKQGPTRPHTSSRRRP